MVDGTSFKSANLFVRKGSIDETTWGVQKETYASIQYATQDVSATQTSEILRIRLQLDSTVEVNLFGRNSIVGAMGAIGGFSGLVSVIIVKILQYFTAVDYNTELIDELFLKKKGLKDQLEEVQN